MLIFYIYRAGLELILLLAAKDAETAPLPGKKPEHQSSMGM